MGNTRTHGTLLNITTTLANGCGSGGLYHGADGSGYLGRVRRDDRYREAGQP